MREGTACVPNIGTSQRRQRLAGGVLALVGSVALVAAFMLTGVPRMARLVVALPLWAGTLGVLQSKAKT